MRARLPRRLRDDRDPSQSSSPWRGGGCNDEEVFCRSTNGGAGRCSFSATGRAANPDLALSGGDAGATLPGGTGRDDYVAGTIAMSGLNGTVVIELTNLGDEAVDIQQGDQLTTIEPGATSMFSSDFCGQCLCMANSQILAKRIGPGSPAEAAPCRARPVVGAEVARWLDRDRAVLRRRSHGPNGRPTGRMEAMAACGALVSPRPQLKREWSPVASPSPSQQKLSQHLKYIVRARISEFESYHPARQYGLCGILIPERFGGRASFCLMQSKVAPP